MGEEEWCALHVHWPLAGVPFKTTKACAFVHRPARPHTSPWLILTAPCVCARTSRLLFQEFALGRALTQRNQRGRHGSSSMPSSLTASTTSSVSASSTPPPVPENPEELAQFVTAFKEMASQLDEDGARNLLMWSPLFMPTVETLMRSGAEARSRKPRLKAGNPHELRHPPPRAPPPAAAERDAHMARLRGMYMSGDGAGDGGESGGGAGGHEAAAPAAAAPEPAPRPAPEYAGRMAAVSEVAPYAGSGATCVGVGGGGHGSSQAHGQRAPIESMPTRAYGASPGSPWIPSGGSALDDDWEDQVDDLLDWTNTLQARPYSP